jgi:uncharacterized protein
VTFLLPFLLAAALPAQPPGKCVLDEAAALAPAEFAALEASCEALDKSGDGQLEVVVTDDFRGDEKEEFANKLFRAWGIGHKDKNDGILIVLSPKMRKWRIEVGYGLEGRITDAQAAEIGRNLGVPAWKAAQWGAGLVAVTNAIVPLVHAEAKLRPVEAPYTLPTATVVIIVLGVLGIVGLLLLALSARAERKRQEAEQREYMERMRREHLAWEADIRRRNATARVYASSSPSTASAPASRPASAPAPAVVAAVAVVEESPRPTYEAPSYDPPSYSSDSGGFDGGGGGDSGGGGAGGDF